jgi:hypothetical protein
MFAFARAMSVRICCAVAVDQPAAAAAVLVTAEAIADSATESTNLTFWFASFVRAFSTGCMFCRAIDSSVTSVS